MTFLREVKNAVSPRAAFLVIGVLALQLLFIASYVGALHDPKPKDVPFGVVAPQQQSAQLVRQLDALPGDPLDPRAVADEAAARQQVLDRDIDGALVVDPRGRKDTLLVASGGGTLLATTLGTLTERLEDAQGRTVRTVDVAPASPQDFDGLSAFYLVVGWCVGGYLCASILAISAGSRAANGQRAVIRLGTMALYAVLGGLGGAVIVGPVLGALPGSVVGLWGLGALIVFGVGALTLALQALTGIVGIGLAVLIVVIAGNPSAGGAFPHAMLPPFWQAIGPWLQPGAGTWAARSIAYFGGRDMATSLWVLAAWAVAGVAVTLLMSARRGSGARTPATGSGAPAAGSDAPAAGAARSDGGSTRADGGAAPR
ncbi:ABC transporter permease [Streptomyces sp. NPDC060194]|uniref:ABC transporter permease n=1 Tax=Streptomyces sp. NPDC060194 TaxID=3347069 RepID=UPI0036520F04